MHATRNRSALIWVAIAAVALASVARAEAGLQSAKGYAHPVLEFLAKNQSQFPVAKPGVSRLAQLGSRRHVNLISRGAGAGAWTAILPVLFIGLVSPLNLFVACPRCLGRVPSSPLALSSFQRPPPHLV